MSIDREATIKIRLAMSGGEAASGIDKVVGRLEAMEKRLSNISGGPASGSPSAPAMHISPIPLPVRITNFADAKYQGPSGATYAKIAGQPRYEQQRPVSVYDEPPQSPAAKPSPAAAAARGASAPHPSEAGRGFLGMMRSIFGSIHFAGGGTVQRRYGTGGDDEPAFLTPGERVMPVDVAQRHAGELDAMMAGKPAPHMADGGVVKRLHHWMKNRYGPKGMAGAMAFGNVATWGASAALTAAMGVPMMLPPGTGVLTGLAAAEIRHRLKSPEQLAREKREAAAEEAAQAASLQRLSGLPKFPEAASHYADGGVIGNPHPRQDRRDASATAPCNRSAESPPSALRPGQRFGVQRFAAGGTIPQHFGSGADDEPAYLTPGERVLPKDVAMRNKAALDAMMTGARHYAGGGTAGAPVASYQGPMNQPGLPMGPMLPQAQLNVYVVNYRDFDFGRGKGGGGDREDKEHKAIGIVYAASRLSGAMGAGAASSLIGAGGDVAAATVAGGPAGIAVAGAVAAIEVFKVGMDKTTAALNIMGDSTTSVAQKNRALAEEFIPFADRFHRLSDALSNTTGRILKSNQERDRAINTQNAKFKRDQAQLAQDRERDQYQAAAAGMGSAGLDTGQIFNTMTHMGQVQRQEQDIRLRARDAVVNQQRQVAGAQYQFDAQTATVTRLREQAARSQAETDRMAAMSRQALEAENRPSQSRAAANATLRGMNSATGGISGFGIRFVNGMQGGVLGIGAALATGPQRDRAGRTEADNREAAARNESTNDRNQLLAQERRLQQDAVELQRQKNQAAMIGVEIAKGELQILQMRSQRMEGDAMRLGSMTRGQRRQAQRAYERVQAMGPEGFDRISQQQRQLARAWNPQVIADMERRQGETIARDAARGGRLGGQAQRDWQDGSASLGDTQQQEQQLAQTIRQELSAISQRSARDLAATFTSTMEQMSAIIQREFHEALAHFDAQMRSLNNHR
jgi:hypothetical protein